MLPIMADFRPAKIKIKGGTVDGRGATLLFMSLAQVNTIGTVTMHREGRQWKVVREDWRSWSR
jgi:hypothetical protein